MQGNGGAPRAEIDARLAGIGDEAGAGLDAQLAAVRALGWRAIELRDVREIALADLPPATFDRLAGRVAAAGLSVVGVASRIGGWARPITSDFDTDLAELERLAPRCARLGTRLVRVMSYPNDCLTEPEWRHRVVRRMRELAMRAEQYGLVLVHENCAGWAGHQPSRALDLLESVGNPALRLLFDTGNGLSYGYDAVEMLRPLAEYVVHVHVKDGVVRDGGVVYTVPGAGQARVADCLRLLDRHGYRGAWSIEPHLSVRPHEGVRGDGSAMAGFVASGRALRALIANEVLPPVRDAKTRPGTRLAPDTTLGPGAETAPDTGPGPAADAAGTSSAASGSRR